MHTDDDSKATVAGSEWCVRTMVTSLSHGPLTRYVKLWVEHAPGMPGTFSPSPTSKETVSWRSRHVRHARAVTHVGMLFRGGGEMFPASPAHAQPAILRIWQEAHGVIQILHTRRYHGCWCLEDVRSHDISNHGILLEYPSLNTRMASFEGSILCTRVFSYNKLCIRIQFLDEIHVYQSQGSWQRGNQWRLLMGFSLKSLLK